jgi:hypothetical protein
MKRFIPAVAVLIVVLALSSVNPAKAQKRGSGRYHGNGPALLGQLAHLLLRFR